MDRWTSHIRLSTCTYWSVPGKRWLGRRPRFAPILSTLFIFNNFINDFNGLFGSMVPTNEITSWCRGVLTVVKTDLLTVMYASKHWNSIHCIENKKKWILFVFREEMQFKIVNWKYRSKSTCWSMYYDWWHIWPLLDRYLTAVQPLRNEEYFVMMWIEVAML